MLANVSHAPVWRSQAYVCLACRRHPSRAPAHQRRWNNNLPHTTHSPSDESWFDTFNDINDSFGTRPPPRSPPKPEPGTVPKRRPRFKASGQAAAEEPKDPLDALRNILETKVEVPRGADADPLTLLGLANMLREDRRSPSPAAKSSTHKAERLQRIGLQEKAQDVYGEKPQAGILDMEALIDQLKEVQDEKAAEDEERRLSWTQAAEHSSELAIKDGADVNEDEPAPRTFPDLDVVKARLMRKVQSPIAAVDDITIPQGTTSRTRKESKNARSSDKAGREADKYKARTSPVASGLGGRLLVPERQPVSLQARWRKQQQEASPYGVQRQASAQNPSRVSFESLRSADKVSDETTITSKNSAPFGLGFVSLRPQDSENAEVGAGGSRDSHSAVESTEEAPAKGRLNDMNSLLASLQAGIKVEEVAKQEAQPEPVPKSQPESATLETSEADAVNALESLYRLRDSRMHSKPLNAVQAGEVEPTTSAAAIQTLSTGAPMTVGRSLGDAMKDGGGAKQKSGSAPFQSPPPDPQPPRESQDSSEQIITLDPSDIEVKPLDIPQPHVPYLEYGLDRVLFNPGVYQLQDPASRVYNFDPYLQDIMPVTDFDFNALKEYKPSSKDQALSALATKEGKRYIGSTSSMTSSLAHFHYLLSNFRPVNTSMYSREFSKEPPKDNFTGINRAPSSIFLRWKNGTYAIDADKEYDSGNVMMLLGKSMELLLTLPKDEYERYRKSDPRQVPEERRTSPESYQYTTMRDILMRSQLDAHDPRLPGNGTFDLKTRAVVTVRMSAADYKPMTGYELFNLQGRWASYEKEYYDMTRSTMLKYMLQARMGRMNGIFVAYHNVKRIFGFQYIPMHEMDRALHGQTDGCLGDQEFKASLDIMNEIFNKATAKFPNQSLRFHFETRPERDDMPTALHVFAEPMSEKDIDAIQNSQEAKIAAFERDIMGMEDEPAVEEENEKQSVGFGSGNTVEAESSAPSTNEDATSKTNNDDVAIGKETQAVNTAKAPADRDFLDTIADQDESLRSLFSATVIVQSKVDGEYIEADRPTDLKKDQKWEIDYILKEYEITRHQWALYEDSKARRRHALYDGSDDDADVDAETDRGLDSYVRFLREMSKRGAEIRERVDREDAGREVVRVDTPLAREREKVESVEDYMEWMYRGKDDGQWGV